MHPTRMWMIYYYRLRAPDFDGDWHKDASEHWKVCERDGCGEEGEKVAHTPGSVATCTSPQVCTVCAYEIEATLVHNFTVFVSTTAICTESGQDTYQCSRCEETEERDRDALGHIPNLETGKCTLCEVLTYNIGDTGPGGGKIYYRSETGFTVQMVDPNDNYIAHYLEAAPTNAYISAVDWGDYGTLVEGITRNATANNISAGNHDGNIPFIGQGRKDTMLIFAHMEGKSIRFTAAQYAVAYRGPNNLTDWFIPSLSELSLYYWSSVTAEKPTSSYFWSSSQSNSNIAWYINFTNGNRTNSNGIHLPNLVRAVRAF